MPEKLLTAAEAAAILGVCRRTLRSHVAAGELAFVNVGRGTVRQHRMFRPADLEAFIDSRVTYTPEAPALTERRRNSSSFVFDFTKPMAEQMALRAELDVDKNCRAPERLKQQGPA